MDASITIAALLGAGLGLFSWEANHGKDFWAAAEKLSYVVLTTLVIYLAH